MSTLGTVHSSMTHYPWNEACIGDLFWETSRTTAHSQQTQVLMHDQSLTRIGEATTGWTQNLVRICGQKERFVVLHGKMIVMNQYGGLKVIFLINEQALRILIGMMQNNMNSSWSCWVNKVKGNFSGHVLKVCIWIVMLCTSTEQWADQEKQLHMQIDIWLSC